MITECSHDEDSNDDNDIVTMIMILTTGGTKFCDIYKNTLINVTLDEVAS